MRYLFLLLYIYGVGATAQTLDFESTAWRALGVYDTWEASPFRTGQLAGNVAIVDDPHPTSTTPNRVLALQRSRWGSNTFGARIDLSQPFSISPRPSYVQLRVLTPVAGRVMVVGLGKRRDRAHQSAEAEQFWVLTQAPIAAGSWQTVTLAFKGNAGVDIHSLVVVPHAESPHALAADFAAYIDDLCITDSDPQAANATLDQLPRDPHLTHTTIRNTNRNGRVTTADGRELTGLAHPVATPLTLLMRPEVGFHHAGVVVKIGRNLHGPQQANGQTQWLEHRIAPERFDAHGQFTLPADWLTQSETEIEGIFVEQ